MGYRPFQVPHLLFHSVHPNEEEYLNILPPNLENILTNLITTKKIVPMSLVTERFIIGSQPDSDWAVISFDDNYANNHEYVTPLLEKYQIPAMMFVLPQMLGTWNRWNTKALYLRRHLSGKELIEMQQTGWWSFGAHSLSHHVLTKLPDKEVDLELRVSREQLEDALQIEIDCFAYPYGRYDQRIIQMVSKHYSFAFSTWRGSKDWRGKGRYKIFRQPIDADGNWAMIMDHFISYDNNRMSGAE